MTNNESQPKPGFRRTASDLLNIPEGTQPKFRNFGDELGQVMNDYHERRRLEEAEANKRSLARAADQLQEFAHVSVENEIVMAGKPALRIVAEHAITELNKPKEHLATEETVEDETQQDTEPRMTISEVRALIDKENEETRDYNGQTGESHPQITDDPVTYARGHGITISY